jgi:hypothetical protein
VFLVRSLGGGRRAGCSLLAPRPMPRLELRLMQCEPQLAPKRATR